MKKTGAVALYFLAALTLRAEIISFGTGSIEYNPATYTEGSFTFTRVSGSQSCLEEAGNPLRSFSLGCVNTPGIGDRFDVTRTGGGLFTFTQFDMGTNSGSASDTMQFLGEVNSIVTEQLLGVNYAAAGFTTLATGFSAPIDRLRLEITGIGSGYLLLDNFVLTPAENSSVPEPSTVISVGLGLLAAGYLRRRAA